MEPVGEKYKQRAESGQRREVNQRRESRFSFETEVDEISQIGNRRYESNGPSQAMEATQGYKYPADEDQRESDQAGEHHDIGR